LAPPSQRARDTLGQPVAAAAPLSISLSGALSGFYDNPACVGATRPTFTLAGGDSRIAFYFRAPTTEGTYLVTASSGALAPAQQSQTVLAQPDALAFITSVPNQVRAGECVAATVGALRQGVDFAVSVDTPVQLSVSLPGALRFYSDVQCATRLAQDSVTIPAGSFTANFWVVPVIGARSHVLTAQAPTGTPATQTWTPRPIVRRNDCALPAGSPSVNCVIPVQVQPRDTTATLLLAQSTTASANSGDGEVVCRLNNGAARVSCQRPASNNDAQVHYQVIEIPRGFRVEANFSSAGCPSFVLASSFSPGQTFVLKTVSDSDALFGGHDVATYTLASTVDLSSSGGCNVAAVQAAQWTGISVTRGVVSGGLPVGAATATHFGLPVSGPNTIVLVQGTSNQASGNPCDYFLRGTVASPTSIAVSRGASGTGASCTSVALQVPFERIDFGSRATVQTLTTQLTSGTSVDVSITPVDATRSFVLSSSQSAGGQGAGELGSSQYQAGLVATELVANPDGGYLSDVVRLRRGSSAGAANVTFSVVQVEP